MRAFFFIEQQGACEDGGAGVGLLAMLQPDAITTEAPAGAATSRRGPGVRGSPVPAGRRTSQGLTQAPTGPTEARKNSRRLPAAKRPPCDQSQGSLWPDRRQGQVLTCGNSEMVGVQHGNYMAMISTARELDHRRREAMSMTACAMSERENLLSAITRNGPDKVPVRRLDGSIPGMARLIYRNSRALLTGTDRWGVGWAGGTAAKSDFEPGIQGYPVSHPLADLDRLEQYPFPDPDEPGIMDDLYNGVDRAQVLVTGELMFPVQDRAHTLMGMDNFLMALVDQPERMHELLRQVADYQIGIVRRYLALGVDIIRVLDDYGTQHAAFLSGRNVGAALSSPSWPASWPPPRLAAPCFGCTHAVTSWTSSLTWSISVSTFLTRSRSWPTTKRKPSGSTGTSCA